MTFQGAEFQRGCKMVENIKNEMRERIRVFKLDPCEYNDAKTEALEEMLTYIEALEKKQPKEEEPPKAEVPPIIEEPPKIDEHPIIEEPHKIYD